MRQKTIEALMTYGITGIATKLYNNGDWLSLEEYFGITSQYPN